jgi:hypothetical protein
MDTAAPRALPRSEPAAARPTRGLTWVRRVAFLIILLAVVVLSCEGLLRVLAGLNPQVEALLSRTPIPQEVEDARLGWRGNPAYPEHDAWGFRNVRVPAQAKAVALGDSQTYGLGEGVSREQAWPQVLGQTARLNVYNMAFPGWGPVQNLDLLPDALSLHPTLLLAALYAGNDLVDSYLAVYLRGYQPDLRTTDPAARDLIALRERIDPFPRKITSPVLPLQRRERRGPSGPWWEQLWQSTRLHDLYRASYRAFNRLAAENEAASRELVVEDDDDIAFDNGRIRTIFNPDYRQQSLTLSDPRISEGQRVALEALRRLRDQAGEAGADVVVVLIPTKELVFKEAAVAEGLEGSRAYWQVLADEEQFWAAARDELQRQGIPTIDTLPALRAVVEADENPYPEKPDGHPNARGYRAIAEQVATELAHLGLPRR